jgi:hypothetical protein
MKTIFFSSENIDILEISFRLIAYFDVSNWNGTNNPLDSIELAKNSPSLGFGKKSEHKIKKIA